MKLEINSRDIGDTSVKLDGQELSGEITGYILTQKALERPMFTVTFSPDEVVINAERVYARKEAEGPHRIDFKAV